MNEHVGEVAPRFVATRRVEDERRVERHAGSGGDVVVLVILQFDRVVDENTQLLKRHQRSESWLEKTEA